MSTPPTSLFNPVIDVVIDDEAWTNCGVGEDVVRQAVSAVLEKLGRTPDGSAITVLLTSDARVRALNARFRDRDAATNVLSFPADDNGYIGDIALAHGTVEREAGGHGIDISGHVSHLVIHGVLHLLGYDHQSDTDADKMEALEVVILDELGIADPYANMDSPGNAGVMG